MDSSTTTCTRVVQDKISSSIVNRGEKAKKGSSVIIVTNKTHVTGQYPYYKKRRQLSHYVH